MNRKRNITIRSAKLPLLAVCLGLLLSGTPACAQPAFALELPLQCQPGETCWVANYIDVNPTPVAQDFQCGSRSYNGHDGVDFAIRDQGVMAAGVPVLASAAGAVKSVRDGMADTGLLAPGAEETLKGKECGNGVVIDHDGGWQTQYCHLRQGSIIVRPGEAVATGATLGAVGMSGWAEFPHVHLAVRHNGVELDPFTGLPGGSACGQPGTPLWHPDLGMTYQQAALYNAGFSAGPPDILRIRAGQPSGNPLMPQSPALVLWVEILGVTQGDLVRFRIIGPNTATLLAEEQRIDKTQARRYIFMGKRRTAQSWPAGEYRGQVTLIRKQAGTESWQESIERVVMLQ